MRFFHFSNINFFLLQEQILPAAQFRPGAQKLNCPFSGTEKLFLNLKTSCKIYFHLFNKRQKPDDSVYFIKH